MDEDFKMRAIAVNAEREYITFRNPKVNDTIEGQCVNLRPKVFVTSHFKVMAYHGNKLAVDREGVKC